jgi:hypothetical protein
MEKGEEKGELSSTARNRLICVALVNCVGIVGTMSASEQLPCMAKGPTT